MRKKILIGIFIAILVISLDIIAVKLILKQLRPVNINQANQTLEVYQTQSEMNETAYQIFEKTDKELNNVYKKILNKYKDDKLFISKFKKAQLAWIKFRDADIESIYPEEDKSFYGSVYPVCVNMAMAEITQERINELKLWLKDSNEGDVCSGSRCMKD